MIPISDTPPRRCFPYVMVGIIVLNALIFVYELMLSPDQLEAFVMAYGVTPALLLQGFSPWLPPGVPVYVTLFTSMFIHGGFLHIIGNMIFLWVFGDNVESALGHVVFAAFYLASGLGATLLHVLVSPDSMIPSIGASGAIAGVLAAYMLYFPRAQVRTLIVFIPFITITRISALFLIAFWIVLQVLSGIAELGSAVTGGVAYWAHVGGFATGLVLAELLKSSLRPSPTG